MSLRQRYHWWRADRLVKRHAKWSAKSLALIARTNPTLAGTTLARLDEMHREALASGNVLALTLFLQSATDVVLDALVQEQKRYARGDS